MRELIILLLYVVFVCMMLCMNVQKMLRNNRIAVQVQPFRSIASVICLVPHLYFCAVLDEGAYISVVGSANSVVDLIKNLTIDTSLLLQILRNLHFTDNLIWLLSRDPKICTPST